jgi:hypothetical protein
MTRAELLLLVVLVAFASLVTVHVTLALGLSLRRPRWRALVAFVVPPFAPFWGFRERMWVRSAVWVVAAVTYVIAFSLARR